MGSFLGHLLDHQQGWGVLSSDIRQHGVSLIELIIGLVIMGILLAMAIPNFMTWIQNTKIRTTAEAMLNGLQLAKAEAVRRNTLIRFQLTDNLSATCALSTSGANWVVSFDDPTTQVTPHSQCASTLISDAVEASAAPEPRIIQVRPAAEGSSGVTVAADQSVVIFNGLGRMTPAAAVNINVSNPDWGACATLGGGGGPIRCLRVAVSAGGQIRLCDPARASTDPVGC